jgi:hypothetical protein
LRKLTHAFVSPAGSLAQGSDPARPAGFSPATWVELDPAPQKKKVFLFVTYDQYPNIFLTFLSYKKTNI